jgi:exonuclease SbcC
VRRLAAELEEAVAGWEPARAEHATAESLARLVRGTGTDNQLQMRLSSYVLATRLDQVLDAANERLDDMRDQRYTLRRTGEARGGVRAGLGLEVLDAWTGEPRAPSTLSGGETFVVSLALALGLADVVMHESGGLHVDTLFIDEGFGMLDPDTLDDVMDRIDALRAGGRTVGVVSHVPELRSRIPAQLHVEKGRHGSSLAVRTLVA